MAETREEQIRTNLKRLAEIHASAVAALEESVAILEAELAALAGPSKPLTQAAEPTADPAWPVIDRGLMCVLYQGKRCFLGNTLPLRLLERLARRPNHYVSYDALLADVWHAVREPSAVRSVVKELRARLRSAGMPALSDAIDGRVPGHYGLMLDRLG